jgi:predicted aspartyl protease
MYLKICGFLLLYILSVFPGVAQVPGFFMKEEKSRVSIPFHASNSLIILPVSINGSPPINFLIDTGVRSNILFSKTLGDALGLEYTRRINLMGADGTNRIMASVSPINTLDLGSVEGRFQSILALEEDFFELESIIGVPVYGIIGYEFFKFNPVKINYDEEEIEFYRSNGVRWKPLFYKKLPMTIEESKAYILAKVKQKNGSLLQTKLLIDTGANHGLLLNRETDSNITMPPLFIESELGQSLGGVLYGYIGRVNSLKLSSLTMKEVLTSYPDETAFSALIKSTGRQGSLGSEVLGRTRMILDYPRSRLLIRKGTTFYNPFEFDMSGIVLRKTPNEENRIYVDQVRPGSPAYKSGILPEDEIIKVNKIPVFLYELSDLVKILRAQEGKEIQLEMRRYKGNDLENFSDYQISLFLKRQI